MSKTVNVRAAGARGDGVSDDTAAFTTASTTAGSHGTVYVPSGVYVLENFALQEDGQRLIGSGRDAVIMRKPTSTAASAAIKTTGKSGIAIAGLSVDCNGRKTGQQGILVQPAFVNDIPVGGGDDVCVRDCYVYDSWQGAVEGIEGQETAIGSIVLYFCTRARAIDNVIERCQLAVTMGPGVIVSRNLVRRARNQAISVVQLGGAMTVEGCVVSDNIVDGIGGTCGIFAGFDGNQVGVCRGLTVRGNQVIGDFDASVVASRFGIYVRPGPGAVGWVVSDNVIHHSGATPSGTQGLRMEASLATSILKGCVIRGNVIRNLGGYGLILNATLQSAVVEGNVLDLTAGMQVSARGSSDNVIVRGNMVHGTVGYPAIEVFAYDGSIANALVDGNLCVSSGGDQGIQLTAATSKTLSANVQNNRVRGFATGIKKNALGGTFDVALLHNDLRTNSTPLDFSSPTYSHENLVA